MVPALALTLSLWCVAPAADAAGYDAALAAVEQANLAVNKDPEANVAALDAAVTALATHGLALAADPAGRESLDLARLNLARALLLTGDEAGAAQVMDTVLREAAGRELAIDRFGPTLVQFHDRRRAALEAAGTATIQVQCQLDCRVVIDAMPAGGDSGPLLLGDHRVWVVAADGSEPLAEHRVELTAAGVTTVVRYPDEPLCEPPPAPAPAPAPTPPPRRLLPRWAEIGVSVIGLATVVAGGVMLGFDGRCPDGLDPVADAQRCPELYEGTAAGLTAIGIGSALTLAGTVTLAVDEVRVAGQRGRQALVTYQLRF